MCERYSHYMSDEEKQEVLKTYGESDELANATLVVWEKRKRFGPGEDGNPKDGIERAIPIIKEILMCQSPVFKTMFTSAFKESQTHRVELPGKSLSVVLTLLDFMYPSKEFTMDDAAAVALLPLSEEYQMDILKKQCITELKKLSKPRLEYVALAIQYTDDIYFRKAAMASCARKLSMRALNNQLSMINRQMCGEKNRQQITDDVILQLVKEKAQILEDFIGNTVKPSLLIIENGQTPKYIDSNGSLANLQMGRRENRVYEWKGSARNDIATLIRIISDVCPFIK